MKTADVAIIGAGIIGAAIAYELVRRARHRVVVIEAERPGAGASGAAAGVLLVAHGRAPRGVMLELRRLSGKLFPEWIDALQSENGAGIWYRPRSVLAVAIDDAAAIRLRSQVELRQQQGFEGRWLTRQEVHDCEPMLSQAAGGACFAEDAQVDAQSLLHALVCAARRRGAQFLCGHRVEQIEYCRDDVALHTGAGVVRAATAVVASGAWSASVLRGFGRRIPIRPSRGEMIALAQPSMKLGHTVVSGHLHLIPRPDGELWVGSTNQYTDYERRLTADGIGRLRRMAEQVMPALCDVSVVRAWAGLRPCATIRRPIIGRLPHWPNVILASGHHRSGVLLAPITARLVGELIESSLPSVPMNPFSYRRH